MNNDDQDLFDRIYSSVAGAATIFIVVIMFIVPWLLIPYVIFGIYGIIAYRPSRNMLEVIWSLLKFFSILTAKLAVAFILFGFDFVLLYIGFSTNLIFLILLGGLGLVLLYYHWYIFKQLILKNICNEFYNAIIW
jgi:hypothetical protein